MTPQQIEAMKLALEALKQIDEAMPFPVAKLAQKAIREVLAQPEQEPVAWMKKMFSPELGEFFDYKDGAFAKETDCQGWTPLYTTPPQRKWVGLTDEEIIDVLHPLVMADMSDEATDYEIARAIEAKLKERNQ